MSSKEQPWSGHNQTNSHNSIEKAKIKQAKNKKLTLHYSSDCPVQPDHHPDPATAPWSWTGPGSPGDRTGQAQLL